MAKAPAAKADSSKATKLPNTPTASKEELLRFYREMVLIRRFEERAGQLYGMGLIGGFCHLYIGQEAVAVGVQESVKQGHDKIITGYRDHGHSFLTDVEVAEAPDQAHAVELARALLETADQHHLAIEAQQVLLRGLGRIGQLGRLAGISFGGGGFRHPSSPGWALAKWQDAGPLVVTERGFSSLRSRKAKPPHRDVTKVHAAGVGPSVAAGAETRIT